MIKSCSSEQCFQFAKTLSEIQSAWLEAGYIMNSDIHSDKSVLFYDKVLLANSQVLKTLKNGYFPQCTEIPTSFEAPNNKSCLGYDENIEVIVKDWLNKGFIQEVQREDLCIINPLTFVTKINEHGQKDRVCLDLSRAVNKLIVPHGAKLDSLPIILETLQQNEFMSSYDLSEMYCSVAIHPDFRKFLGFKAKINGLWKFFRSGVYIFVTN